MEHIKKIGGINLILLVVYMLLLNVSALGSDTGSEAGLGVLIMAAFIIGCHVFINLAVGIVMFIKRDPRGKAFLLSSVVVLVVGFSSCLGSIALY
jgi:hypothetical protein